MAISLSLASQAMLVPQGEGTYRLLFLFSVPYASIRKNEIPQDFEQVLRIFGALHAVLYDD